MSDANELAGLAAGLAIALPVALGLVWVCLLGALRLLPQSPQRLGTAASPAPGTAGLGKAAALLHGKRFLCRGSSELELPLAKPLAGGSERRAGTAAPAGQGSHPASG